MSYFTNKNSGTESARFPNFFQIVKVVLMIPHSNAGEEHVFSVTHKISHDDRGKLQLERTLSSLVTVKLNLPETKAHPCYAFEPSKTLLQQAKTSNIILQ